MYTGKSGLRPRSRLVVLGMAISVVITACGGSSGSGGGQGDSSTDQVLLADENGDWADQAVYRTAAAKYWPDLGFTKPPTFVQTDDYLPALVGGSVWIAQGESEPIWKAMARGGVPLKLVMVYQNKEDWILAARPSVDPKKLAGRKITGGAVGERNITIARSALQEMGVNPDSLEWVTVPGSGEVRTQALIAGQVDIASIPADLLPVAESAGMKIIYQSRKTIPVSGYIVTADTMSSNKAAVCAFVEGSLQARQWVAAGEGQTNLDAVVTIMTDAGMKPNADTLTGWPAFVSNLAPDGGASAAQFDEWNQQMIDAGNVPKDFDWRKNVDFSCLWQAQEKLGLQQNPPSSSLQK